MRENVVENVEDNNLFERFEMQTKLVGKKLGRKIRKTLKKTNDQVKRKVMPHIRKVVTGDKNVRIRDFRKTAPVVRFVDKISFFFGVITLLLVEGVFLRAPDLLYFVFLLLCPLLIMIRIPLYYMEKYHFFTLDFCYFVNAMYVLCIGLHALESYGSEKTKLWVNMSLENVGWEGRLETLNASLLRLVFALTTGPLVCAIWVWRNSAVFHSLDKMTSLFIHIIPAFLAFSQRWYTNDSSGDDAKEIEGNDETMRFVVCREGGGGGGGQMIPSCNEGMSLHEWFVYPMIVYVMWQIFYLVVTEILLAKMIRNDRAIETSVRWLARDRRNFFNQLTKKICRKIGILGPNEEFDGETKKTKAVFIATQFSYTILTFIPVKFCYEYFWIHAAFLLITSLKSLWNGAAFYIEVFAVRYVRKFKTTPAESSTPVHSPDVSPSIIPISGNSKKIPVTSLGGSLATSGGGGAARTKKDE